MESLLNDALKAQQEENKPKKTSKILDMKEPGIEDRELEELVRKTKIRITVVGAGGGGNNTIQRCKDEGIKDVTLVAVNTDAQQLLRTKADKKVLIGKKMTRGLGAGASPRVGEDAAYEAEAQLQNTVSSSNVVIVTAGLGGGTGTGSSPVVADLARATGALTLSVVTYPFKAEGRQRAENARLGLDRLRKVSDTVIVVPNDKLLEIAPRLPLRDAFRLADEIIMRTIKGITETIDGHGIVTIDFSDLLTIMKDGGVSMIGIGEGDKENRAMTAVENAINSPLLDVDISNAKGALISVSGGPDMTVSEAQMAVEEIRNRINRDARIIWGARIEPELAGYIKVMLILTGVESPQIVGPKTPGFTTGRKDQYGIDSV
jgi:cell division protein FtsZ